MSYVKNSTGGKILAVTQAIIDRVDTQSVASGGTWNPTIPNTGTAGQYFGLTVSPIRADSKILFQGFVMAACPDAGTVMLILRKDGSDITEAIATNNGSRRPCHSGNITSANAACIPLPINYLMPLSSASPFEFHIELAHESGSTRTMYINRSAGDGDNNQYGRYVSIFTATEFLS